MKRTAKNAISFLLMLLLVMSLAAPALASDVLYATETHLSRPHF